MFLTKLDVVNECLASMGESAANSLNESNSFITSALRSLEQATISEQSPGWYFNIDRVRLEPTVDGEFYVPHDVISVDIDKSPNWLVIRGRRLYNRDKSVYLTDTRPVELFVVRAIPFEDLPYHAQRMVQAATVVAFQKSYDGDELKLRDAQEEYSKARTFLMSDHIRSVRANMLYHGDVAVRQSLNRFHTGQLPYRG